MQVSPQTLDRFCRSIAEQVEWRNSNRPADRRIVSEPVVGAVLVQGGRCVVLAVPAHEIACLDSDSSNSMLHRGVNARLHAAIRELDDLIPEECVRTSEYLVTHCLPVAVDPDLQPIQSGGPA